MPRSKECEVEIVFLLSCQRQPCVTSPALLNSGVQRVAKQLHDGLGEAQDIFLVAMRLGETPVHIPNTMVKP